MGRARKSVEEKMAKGTLRPCREVPAVLPEGAVQLSAEPPRGIAGEAQDAWKLAVACCPFQLSAIDSAALERWCRLWAQWRKVMKKLEHEDLFFIDAETGITTAHPGLAVAEKLNNQLSRLESALGFSPIPRTRLKMSDDKPKKNEFDDI